MTTWHRPMIGHRRTAALARRREPQLVSDSHRGMGWEIILPADQMGKPKVLCGIHDCRIFYFHFQRECPMSDWLVRQNCPHQQFLRSK
jgi:hypothetical protein